jgi:hypothetical protein
MGGDHSKKSHEPKGARRFLADVPGFTAASVKLPCCADDLCRIVLAFRKYRLAAEREVARWEQNFSRLPDSHKRLLPGQQCKVQKAREAVQVNNVFLNTMLASFDDEENVPAHLANANAAGDEVAASGYRLNAMEEDKVRSA